MVKLMGWKWYIKDEETETSRWKKMLSYMDTDRLKRMYDYLNDKENPYFIEVNMGNEYIPIGDVTFWKRRYANSTQGNKNYRGKNRYKVIKALIGEKERY